MTATIAGAVTAYLAGVRAALANKQGSDGQPVLVTLGDPGQFQPASVVGVAMTVRDVTVRPTMAPTRSREATLEIDSVISVYVAGDETVQQAANDGALDLFATVEAWVRTSPNEKLSGNARDAYMSGFTFNVAIATQAFDDPEIPPVPTGRIAEITATVTVYVRY